MESTVATRGSFQCKMSFSFCLFFACIYKVFDFWMHFVFLAHAKLGNFTTSIFTQKYYFPAKWEILELNFLIQFFDLKDPTSIASSKNGGGSKQNSINAGSNLLGKSIQLVGTNGGNSQDHVAGAANPNGRRKAGRRRSKSWMGDSTTPVTSKIGMNSKQNPSLFASFSTSIIKSFQGGAQPDMLNFVVSEFRNGFLHFPFSLIVSNLNDPV